MLLIAQTRPEQPIQVLDSLPPSDADLLRHYWRVGYARLGDQAGTLHQVLARVKAQRAWIACDCRQTPHEPPPVVFPRETADGRYFLARNGRRSAHDPACVFAWAEGELGPSAPPAAAQHDDPVQHPLQVRPYQRTPNGLVFSDAILATGIVPHLFAVTMQVLTDAKLNVLDGVAKPEQHTAALKDTAQSITADASNCPLWISLSFLHNGWAHQHWQRHPVADPAIPGQGYIVLRVRGIRPDAILVKDQWLDLGCPLVDIHGLAPAGEVTGHFIVTIVVVDDPAAGAAQPQAALATAVANRTCCPISSSAEADLVTVLDLFARDMRHKLQGAPQPAVVAERPLFPLPDCADTNPYLVRAGDFQLVIDCVSVAAEGESAQRRRASRESLARYGPVFVDHRASVPANVANRRLLQYLHGWIRAVGVAPLTSTSPLSSQTNQP